MPFIQGGLDKERRPRILKISSFADISSGTVSGTQMKPAAFFLNKGEPGALTKLFAGNAPQMKAETKRFGSWLSSTNLKSFNRLQTGQIPCKG